MRLSQRALGKTASGEVVNLLANDVNQFDMMSHLVNSLWTAPALTIIVAILLWREIGIAGVVGILVILIVVIIQSKFDIKKLECSLEAINRIGYFSISHKNCK